MPKTFKLTVKKFLTLLKFLTCTCRFAILWVFEADAASLAGDTDSYQAHGLTQGLRFVRVHEYPPWYSVVCATGTLHNLLCILHQYTLNGSIFVGIPNFIPNTVYSFEFTKSYFHPISETDSPGLEFPHSPIFLHNPLYIIQFAHFQIHPKVSCRKGRKYIGGQIFPVYSILVNSIHRFLASSIHCFNQIQENKTIYNHIIFMLDRLYKSVSLCIPTHCCVTEYAGVDGSGAGDGELPHALRPAGEQHRPATQVGRRGQPQPQYGPQTL